MGDFEDRLAEGYRHSETREGDTQMHHANGWGSDGRCWKCGQEWPCANATPELAQTTPSDPAQSAHCVDRLAAALRKVLADPTMWDDEYVSIADAIRIADPTLICPDRDAHARADAARQYIQNNLDVWSGDEDTNWVSKAVCDVYRKVLNVLDGRDILGDPAALEDQS